ncbi:hypothetical protein GYMLUDRAFT_222859 [Collybiopsis luxurians FD-317 M1]|uniref:Uncharacterized protein n=1 Tax=Collybiopsis luxurians FD-317 M1 TaxID=944289 RepID=A0A0D0CU92_9AGAR|nr:hypothetical protein GYMLUDRAFT_222859 [Collybiopsis luxurians FD-317 M1]
MIIKQQDQEPEDAPPAYEVASPSSSSAPPQTFSDTKVPYPSSSSSSLQSPNPSPISPTSPSYSSKGKGKAPASSWWSFGTSQTTREIRSTVLGIVRDLVKVKNGNSTAAQSILESCAEACSGYSLSFSLLLQEKSIESHTPLYWAIVNRPPEQNNDGSGEINDLLLHLLSYTAPLSPSILTEVRQACLITDDQLLFQRLRLSPEFASLSGTDEMLLGESMIPDDVNVENMEGDQGAFAMDFRIPHFQKRMRVSNEVAVEFIARGRLWRLALCVADKRRSRHNGPTQGSWCIVLSIMENSAPTWLDSQLIIPDASSNKKVEQPVDLLQYEPVPTPAPSPSSMFAGILGDRSGGKKPPITFRIQSQAELCSASERFSRQRQSEIVVPLDGVPLGTSLQHAGSSYIGADESLSGRLEARLTKPQGDAECIIC